LGCFINELGWTAGSIDGIRRWRGNQLETVVGLLVVAAMAVAVGGSGELEGGYWNNRGGDDSDAGKTCWMMM